MRARASLGYGFELDGEVVALTGLYTAGVPAVLRIFHVTCWVATSSEWGIGGYRGTGDLGGTGSLTGG